MIFLRLVVLKSGGGGGSRPGPGIGLQLITPFGELTTLGRYQTSQHKVIIFGI